MVVWLRLQRSSSFSRLYALTSLSTSHECGLAATKRASATDTSRLGDLRLKCTNNCPSTEFQICSHAFSLCRHERACRHVKLGPGPTPWIRHWSSVKTRQNRLVLSVSAVWTSYYIIVCNTPVGYCCISHHCNCAISLTVITKICAVT